MILSFWTGIVDPDRTAPGSTGSNFRIMFQVSEYLGILRYLLLDYRKNCKILDTQKFAVITLKVEQCGFSLE